MVVGANLVFALLLRIRRQPPRVPDQEGDHKDRPYTDPPAGPNTSLTASSISLKL